MIPQPESWADYVVGSMKGVYGSTKEEIDRYIAEVRQGWEIDGLKNALASDDDLKAVYEATSSHEAMSLSTIQRISAVKNGGEKLEELGELNAVKHVKRPTGKEEPYYLRTP